jgi:hypothetical protein
MTRILPGQDIPGLHREHPCDFSDRRIQIQEKVPGDSCFRLLSMPPSMEPLILSMPPPTRLGGPGPAQARPGKSARAGRRGAISGDFDRVRGIALSIHAADMSRDLSAAFLRHHSVISRNAADL